MTSSSRHGACRLAAAIGSTLLSAFAFGATASPPGMTYESLKDLPDLSGGWVPISGLFVVPNTARSNGPIPSGIPPSTPLPRELKPEIANLLAYPEKKMNVLGLFSPDWAYVNSVRADWIEKTNQIGCTSRKRT